VHLQSAVAHAASQHEQSPAAAALACYYRKPINLGAAVNRGSIHMQAENNCFRHSRLYEVSRFTFLFDSALCKLEGEFSQGIIFCDTPAAFRHNF